ncbi:Hydra magnipapillata [Nesidiocoris tenuis]|uniref:Hydra magnipapillata n=1 Tax=Nesidiocoris tenuis TaxID=355587 RepID=A0ABN7ABV9_9HEMI|nr:Hydra magnipapillata [Nesidiocoris tenuis]
MEVNLKLEKPTDEKLPDFPFLNLIGSLMYIATATRPDIMYPVSHLSQFNTCFRKEHWLAAKRVLRYLKHTKSLNLVFQKTADPCISGLSDANWGNCLDGRSYTGFCFLYSGTAISWEAKKQRTVAQSTAESEYMALSEAAKEALHLKNLADHLGIRQNTVEIETDNQAAQNWAINPIVTPKSKHIALKEHFIRDAVHNKDVQLKYCPTEDMTADVFTKSLAAPKLILFREKLGLRDCS